MASTFPAALRQIRRELVMAMDPRELHRNIVVFAAVCGTLTVGLYWALRVGLGAGGTFSFLVLLCFAATAAASVSGKVRAEMQGRRRVQSLRRSRSTMHASCRRPDGRIEQVMVAELRPGDIVIVREGDVIPGDGEVIEGAALIDESAITGESASVIRQEGGDKAGVSAGTKILSGKVVIRIRTHPGEALLDQMIAMTATARLAPTSLERSYDFLLSGLMLLASLTVLTVLLLSWRWASGIGAPILAGLLLCLMPTLLATLLPTIGIAAMNRLLSCNVLVFSADAIDKAGIVDVVVFDKTGTLTMGDRPAVGFRTAPGVAPYDLIEAALLASLQDETPEGRSIVQLAKKGLKIHGEGLRKAERATFIAFSSQTRMSGVDLGKRMIRKGAWNAIREWIAAQGGSVPAGMEELVSQIARAGLTPLAVAESSRLLGIVELGDTLKSGIKHRLLHLRSEGIRSVMMTGDHPLTAASIAAETGVDDVMADAKPADKLAVIRQFQSEGRIVGMIGDGMNDAPALAQADVAVAMYGGAEITHDAANMVDLDSSPTKLLDVIEMGKAVVVTRKALAEFALAQTAALYVAVLPTVLGTTHPWFRGINVLRLSGPGSAVLAGAIMIVASILILTPFALRGFTYRTEPRYVRLSRSATAILTGAMLTLASVKAIDAALAALRI